MHVVNAFVKQFTLCTLSTVDEKILLPAIHYSFGKDTVRN